MLLSKYRVFAKRSLLKSVSIFIIAGLLWLVWWRFICTDRYTIDAKLPFGGGFNPPSISEFLLALSMLFACYGGITLFERNKYTIAIIKPFAWIGKHTLYIFLYHRLFLDFLLTPYVVIANVHVKRIVYLAVMFFGSILIDAAVNGLKNGYMKLHMKTMVVDRAA